MKNKILFICVLAAALFIWSCNEKSPVAPDFANQSETLDKRVHVPVGLTKTRWRAPRSVIHCAIFSPRPLAPPEIK